MDSFISYPGSKRRVLSIIRPYFPKHYGVYHEPFCGSAIVFFDLCPPTAMLSDTNSELIVLLNTIANQPDQVINCLKDMHNNKEYYMEIRQLDRGYHRIMSSKIFRAARMIYLNKVCFNSLWRTNKKGQFNVPYGDRTGEPHKSPELFHIIRQASKVLNNAILSNMDYTDMLKHTRRGDFVYLDPPYPPISPSAFTSYTGKDFSYTDHLRLKEECDTLHKNGVKFMLSIANYPWVRELYNSYFIKTLTMWRGISGHNHARSSIDELIIFNYKDTRE